jgi:RNA polymerase subunit RPABC4/transcription elongation factor Spt4
MVFACKKCKKVFRKDMREFEESDEYCPGCDNHYYVEAKTAQNQGVAVIAFEGTSDMIRDERVKSKSSPSSALPRTILSELDRNTMM